MGFVNEHDDESDDNEEEQEDASASPGVSLIPVRIGEFEQTVPSVK
jgi:hypothetical protein